MKENLVFILLFALSFSLNAQRDSIKKEKLRDFRGVYITSYYSLGGEDHYVFSKYSDHWKYALQSRNFEFKSPNIGIGYVLNKREFFIRTDISYSFGSKKLDDTYGGNSKSINGRSEYYELNPMSIYYSGGSYKGAIYYRYKDYLKGKLNLHYVDLGMVLGGNMLPYLRLYSGWRYQALVLKKFSAIQDRTAERFMVIGYTSQSTIKDSLIETSYLQYKNDEIENLSNQDLAGSFYLTFGFCGNFKIKKQMFMFEMQYDYNGMIFRRPEYSRDYMSIKLSYLIDYSTDFGNKKSKD